MITGAICFGADLAPSRTAHMVFVRSDMAHADLVGIGTDVARAMPGVLGIFTAADLGLPLYTQVDGLPDDVLQPPLALDEVRYVGQRIAAVVAETLAEASDAAEAVDLGFKPRPPVLDVADSAVFVLDLAVGDSRPGEPDDVVVTLETHQPRVAPSPMETTTAYAEPGPGGALTVIAGTQLPASTHSDLSRYLGIDADKLRLRAAPMGGAFGVKTVGGSPDLSVLCACALRLGVPIQFDEDRSGHTAVNHARDQHQRWELRASPAGRLRHIALDVLADAGAYASTGAMEPATTALLATGAYRVRSVEVRARAALTNTAPTGPYRGPGRAEASAGLERAIDLLAGELKMDPLELRRRNLLQPDDHPWTTATGVTYDRSDHPVTLDRVLEMLPRREWVEAQHAKRAAGDTTQIGIGVTTWVDATAGYFAEQESALCVTPEGVFSLEAGAAPAGQGHESSFRGLLASRLGLAACDIEVELPDTAGAVTSVGSFGSRSAQVVASAVDAACTEVLSQAFLLVAYLLEANPGDVVVHADSRLGIAGSPDRSMSMVELGVLSHSLADLPSGVEQGLACVGHFSQEQRTFPSGCHGAVVSVDTQTGGVDLLRLVTVTDCGTVLDHAAAEGQAQGGMVQGAAQALWEEVIYDADGNLLTGNLLTYGMPAASELPAPQVEFMPTPTDRNPMGAKGLGETGTVGAPAAVQNAVVDALSHLGVDHVEMPCTPMRIWEALDAGAGQVARSMS
jgi:carbon-monoxide dehydrogenase large subunit